MSKQTIYLIIICILFCFGCTPKKKNETSKAFVLKEFQDKRYDYGLHQFPIIAESSITPEVIVQLDKLLADKNNFDEFGKNCFEPILGFQIVQADQSVKSILISIDCARMYIYQNDKKIELILSQLGKDNLRILFVAIFPDFKNKVKVN